MYCAAMILIEPFIQAQKQICDREQTSYTLAMFGTIVYEIARANIKLHGFFC